MFQKPGIVDTITTHHISYMKITVNK